MAENEEKNGLLDKIHVRDVVLAILCGIAIYLLRSREKYSIKPVWRHDILQDNTFKSKYQLSPIVTDLEGDGNVEVIVLTSDGDLVVLQPQESQNKSKILPHVREISSISLPRFLKDDDIEMMVPVRMDTGYLVSYSSTENRSQVIVVVFNNWHVMCFSHDLMLLWEQSLTSVSSNIGQYEAQAFVVLVMPHSLTGTGNGTVLIGGGFEHESHHVSAQSAQQEKKEYRGLRGAVSATPGKRAMLQGDKLKHFSSFALNGYNGSVIWHHLPGDFENKQQDSKEEVFHWKLGLKKHSLHIGESHWAKYRQDILHNLPHRWQDMSDTRMELANIKSSDRVTEPGVDTDIDTLSHMLGLHDSHIVGKSYGGMKPHSKHEHVKNPNVIMIFHHKGVEVLSLKTGRPLTQIDMQMTLTSHADVNNDGYLDKVEASLNNDCTAVVSTADELDQVLFHGPLCHSPGWIGSVSMASSVFPDQQVPEDTHVAVSPLIVPSVAAQTGFFRHLQGYGLARHNQGSDTVFLTSNGRVTSYSPRGDFNWQIRTNAGWADIVYQAVNNYIKKPGKEIYEKSFRPSLESLPLKIYGKINAALVTGWSTMSLVSLKDGTVLVEHSLPCQPSIKPVLADFNNDGYTDIIVTCPSGYIAFLVEPVMNLWYTAVVSAAVILTMMVLHWTCITSAPRDDRLTEFD